MDEHLRGMQKEEFVNTIKALNNEEQLIAIKLFPSDVMWDELRRREEYEREMLHKMRELMNIKEEI